MNIKAKFVENIGRILIILLTLFTWSFITGYVAYDRGYDAGVIDGVDKGIWIVSEIADNCGELTTDQCIRKYLNLGLGYDTD